MDDPPTVQESAVDAVTSMADKDKETIESLPEVKGQFQGKEGGKVNQGADNLDDEKGIYLSDVSFNENNNGDAAGQHGQASAGDQAGSVPLPVKPQPQSSLKMVIVLTFFATLGGFQMGYNIGIVSGAMLYIKPFFHLSIFWVQAIVSAAVGSAAVSSVCAGWTTDKLGRRATLLLDSAIFTAGAVIMAVAPVKELLLVGRIVSGLAIGLASVVVPIYVAEASPVYVRGRMTTMWQVMINLGILVSSLVSAGFSNLQGDDGWRYMLGVSGVVGVGQFAGMLFMPESPRWLVDKGLEKQAERVLVRTRGHTDVGEELQDIKNSVEDSKAMQLGGFRILGQIAKTAPVRRALIVGVGLLMIQQWCGINTAIYYSGTVLKMAGFPVSAAVWLVVLPAALLFLAGLISIYLVDRVGRKPLLVWSMVGTIVGLIIIAVGFQLFENNPPTIDTTIVESYGNGTALVDRCYSKYSSCMDCIKDEDCGFCSRKGADFGTCLSADGEESSLHGRCNASDAGHTDFKFARGYCPSDDYSWITTLGVALFVFLFSPGMAPMPWTINAEIYPLWARGTCNSIAATSAWVSNLIISFTFLTLIETITSYGTFWMFTGFSVLGLIFFVLLVPETKDKSLEQVEELFMSNSQIELRRTAMARDKK